MRRYTMSSLLFSLAQKALLEERAGAAWEQVHCHLTGDGDYSGIAVVDTAQPLSPAADSSATARGIDEGKVPALAEERTSTEGAQGVRSMGQAHDDISAADRIRNGEQQATDEAARLRQVEAFRQQEAERLAALRAAREAGQA